MISVKALPEFSRWMDGLPDAKVKAIVAARIRRLSLGLPGDVAPVGDGVSELRIHIGAGWRIEEEPGSRHSKSQGIGEDPGLRS